MNPKNNKADLDDILFENRERNYGAFPLRKSYSQRLMGVTVGILGLVVSLGFVIDRNLILPKKIVAGQVPYCPCFGCDLTEHERYISIYLNDFDQIGNIPPKPPKPPKNKILSFKIPRPVKKLEFAEAGTIEKKISLPNINIATLPIGPDYDLLDFESFADETAYTCNCDAEDHSTVLGDTYPDVNYFLTVGDEPQPINYHEVMSMIRYPSHTRDCCIEGQVVIRVLIDKCGNYQKHKVIKEVHPFLSEACEKHVHKLKFTPAIQSGKCIPFWVNIPFKFHLLN